MLLLNHREDLHYYMELIDIGKKLRGSVRAGLVTEKAFGKAPAGRGVHQLRLRANCRVFARSIAILLPNDSQK